PCFGELVGAVRGADYVPCFESSSYLSPRLMMNPRQHRSILPLLIDQELEWCRSVPRVHGETVKALGRYDPRKAREEVNIRIAEAQESIMMRFCALAQT